MQITERHAMQQDIAIFNVLNERNRTDPTALRMRMARAMRQARRLRDSDLIRIARTLPR